MPATRLHLHAPFQRWPTRVCFRNGGASYRRKHPMARGKGYLAIIDNSQADARRRRNVKGELRSGTRSIL